jgi:hypothetical protein
MNLASAQRIVKITPIEGADAIETAMVLGWEIVIKKGEYQVGDLCCYIQIDTVVPEKPEYEFLRERKFRVKTIKLRKQISQGLIVALPEGNWSEGDDLTNVIGVKKYEKVDNNPARYEKPRKPKTWYGRFVYNFKYNFLYKAFPFDNELMIVEVTGSELLWWLSAGLYMKTIANLTPVETSQTYWIISINFLTEKHLESSAYPHNLSTIMNTYQYIREQLKTRWLSEGTIRASDYN